MIAHRRLNPVGLVGLFGLPAAAFVALKLLHWLNWPWWLVLAPIWVGWLIAAGCIIAAACRGIARRGENEGGDSESAPRLGKRRQSRSGAPGGKNAR